MTKISSVSNGSRFSTSACTLIFLLFPLSLLSAPGAVPVVTIGPTVADSGLAIGEFRVQGPFPRRLAGVDSSDNTALNFDYLAQTGSSESISDAETFGMPAKTGAIRNLDVKAEADTGILNLASSFPGAGSAFSYAAAVIQSTADRDVILSTGAEGLLQIRVNRELIYSDRRAEDRSLHKFKILTGIHLRKGANFLLVKVGSKDKDWHLIAAIFPFARGITLAQENAIDPLLVSNIIPAGEALPLRGDLLGVSTKTRIRILDDRHRQVLSKDVVIGRHLSFDLPGLGAERIYYCVATDAGGHDLTSAFFYGSLENADKALAARAESALAKSGDEETRINVEAYVERVSHLLKPDSRKSEFWEHKTVYAIGDLSRILDDLEAGKPAFRNVPGYHIRGFRAAVDGEVQHYSIQVPAKAVQSGNPIPLVIVLPFTTGSHLPFLESYFLHTWDEQERYRILSEQLGFAVMLPLGRGNYLGDSAIGTEDVMEALEAVRKDYSIDNTRIYLEGTCEAGRLALMLAEHYPDRFAAVAAEGPITLLNPEHSYSDVYRQFEQPIVSIANLINTPVFIIHDENDDQVPLAESKHFIEEGAKVGVVVQFKQMSGGAHGFHQDPMEFKRRMLMFFQGKQLTKNPRHVVLQTSQMKYGTAHWIALTELGQEMKLAKVDAHATPGNGIEIKTENVRSFEIRPALLPTEMRNGFSVKVDGKETMSVSADQAAADGPVLRFRDGMPERAAPIETQVMGSKSAVLEGPILEAFAKPVLLVEGTQGSDTENSAMHGLAESFRQKWQEAYFVLCPGKPDTEVTDQDIAHYNLVLIGDARTNAVVAKLAPGLPYSLDDGRLTLGERTYEGETPVGYEFVAPNPLYSSNYVVVVGMSRWVPGRIWDMHLSRFGVTDYLVWNIGPGRPEVNDAGYFDFQWKTAESLRYDKASFAGGQAGGH